MHYRHTFRIYWTLILSQNSLDIHTHNIHHPIHHTNHHTRPLNNNLIPSQDVQDIHDELLTHMQHLRQTILTSTNHAINHTRHEIYSTLDGDCFYPNHTWPQHIRNHIWDTPTSDEQTFKIILFFIGNGCSPFIIYHWILASYHQHHDKLAKRINQISWIYRNLASHSNRWYFHHIDSRQSMFLNGRPKRSTTTT